MAASLDPGFFRLEELSAIRLPEGQEEILMKKLLGVIGYLSQLETLDVDGYDWDSNEIFCPLSDEVVSYEDPDGLFANTKHPKVGKSIVIKTVM